MPSMRSSDLNLPPELPPDLRIQTVEAELEFTASEVVQGSTGGLAEVRRRKPAF